MAIWWQDDFLESQDSNVRIVYSENGIGKLPIVLIAKSIEVGYIGPYGGVWPGNVIEDCETNWKVVLNLSRGSNSTPIKVRLPPLSHFHELSKNNREIIEKFGFRKKYADINSTLDVTDKFENNFNRNRKRDLSKAAKLELKFVESHNMKETFLLIQKNRLQKKLSMSIKLEKLLNNYEKFRGIYSLFGVKYRDDLICSAIVMNVCENLRYVHMWGNDKAIPQSGPGMTLLSHGILQNSLGAKYKKVCLGVSSLNGVPDEGLLQFKNSLGAYEEERPTYVFDPTTEL